MSLSVSCYRSDGPLSDFSDVHQVIDHLVIPLMSTRWSPLSDSSDVHQVESLRMSLSVSCYRSDRPLSDFSDVHQVIDYLVIPLMSTR